MLTEPLAALAAAHTHLTALADTVLAAPPPDPAAGIPNPTPSEVPGLGPAAVKFIAWAKWIVRGAGVMGVLWCGGMMILGRRNRSATAVDGAIGLPWVLGGVSVAAVAATLVGAVL